MQTDMKYIIETNQNRWYILWTFHRKTEVKIFQIWFALMDRRFMKYPFPEFREGIGFQEIACLGKMHQEAQPALPFRLCCCANAFFGRHAFSFETLFSKLPPQKSLHQHHRYSTSPFREKSTLFLKYNDSARDIHQILGNNFEFKYNSPSTPLSTSLCLRPVTVSPWHVPGCSSPCVFNLFHIYTTYHGILVPPNSHFISGTALHRSWVSHGHCSSLIPHLSSVLLTYHCCVFWCFVQIKKQLPCHFATQSSFTLFLSRGFYCFWSYLLLNITEKNSTNS